MFSLIIVIGALIAMTAIISDAILKYKKNEDAKQVGTGSSKEEKKVISDLIAQNKILLEDNADLKKRLENLEVIVTSSSWDALPEHDEKKYAKEIEEIAKRMEALKAKKK